MSTPTDNPEAGDAAGPEGVSDRPVLRVITPDATAEEVAALVAVLAAMGGGEGSAPRKRPEWNKPARLVRQTRVPGPGAWRASGLPGG